MEIPICPLILLSCLDALLLPSFSVIGGFNLQRKGWFIFTSIFPLNNVLKNCLDIDFFIVVDSYSVAIPNYPLIFLSCLFLPFNK
jgi:hypothetical protein